MNPIEDAIKVLRDLDMRSDLVEKLEALLKQEPIGYVDEEKLSQLGDTRIAGVNVVVRKDSGVSHTFPIWGNPRPPCDLKALVEDVRQYAIAELARQTSRNFAEATFSGTFNADAIIAKHTGGK